jgi:hypothetical protein
VLTPPLASKYEVLKMEAVKKETTPNYTKEQEQALRDLASEHGEISFEQCQQLAEQWGKKPRSIVGKINSLELPYKAKPAPVKKVDNAPTKAMMVTNLGSVLGVQFDELDGMDKPTIKGLTKLTKAILTLVEAGK